MRIKYQECSRKRLKKEIGRNVSVKIIMVLNTWEKFSSRTKKKNESPKLCSVHKKRSAGYDSSS